MHLDLAPSTECNNLLLSHALQAWAVQTSHAVWEELLASVLPYLDTVLNQLLNMRHGSADRLVKVSSHHC